MSLRVFLPLVAVNLLCCLHSSYMNSSCSHVGHWWWTRLGGRDHGIRRRRFRYFSTLQPLFSCHPHTSATCCTNYILTRQRNTFSITLVALPWFARGNLPTIRSLPSLQNTGHIEQASSPENFAKNMYTWRADGEEIKQCHCFLEIAYL